MVIAHLNGALRSSPNYHRWNNSVLRNCMRVNPKNYFSYNKYNNLLILAERQKQNRSNKKPWQNYFLVQRPWFYLS
jgi:hypothetical protein